MIFQYFNKYLFFSAKNIILKICPPSILFSRYVVLRLIAYIVVIFWYVCFWRIVMKL